MLTGSYWIALRKPCATRVGLHGCKLTVMERSNFRYKLTVNFRHDGKFTSASCHVHMFYDRTIAIRAFDAQYQGQLHHPDPDLDPLLQVIVIASLDRLVLSTQSL